MGGARHLGVRAIATDRDIPFTRVGWMEIQHLVSVLRVVWWAANEVIGAVRDNKLTTVLALLEAWVALLPSRIAF